jgi:small subunit ribosomal protein S6
MIVIPCLLPKISQNRNLQENSGFVLGGFGEAASCPQGVNFMPQYETMYILRPDLGDEQTDQAIGKYQNILLEQGAENLDTQHRGRRRLAYEIKNQREGVYIQMNYSSSGAAVAAMERAMRLSDEVIRYLTIKLEDTTNQVAVEA